MFYWARFPWFFFVLQKESSLESAGKWILRAYMHSLARLEQAGAIEQNPVPVQWGMYRVMYILAQWAANTDNNKFANLKHMRSFEQKVLALAKNQVAGGFLPSKSQKNI